MYIPYLSIAFYWYNLYIYFLNWLKVTDVKLVKLFLGRKFNFQFHYYHITAYYSVRLLLKGCLQEARKKHAGTTYLKLMNLTKERIPGHVSEFVFAIEVE